MTILVCQKRHHEPHITEKPRPSPYGWRYSVHWCDGRAVWPYARPKPPSIASVQYTKYAEDHNTIAVWPVLDMRWMIEPPGSTIPEGHDVKTFPKDEWLNAIQYAQDLVNERRKNSGLVQRG